MKPFNLIVVGYGGQGILTLTDIISKAALKQGYDVKEAELHGLAQRGGSLDCHVRFGGGIHSSLIPRAKADLIIALEALEALRACYWVNKNTVVLINSKIFRSSLNMKKILREIKKFTRKIYVVDADEIVKKETGNILGVNIFMLGYALKKKLLPLKKENVWKAVEERIRKRFLQENRKIFEKSFKY
ncbi:MAG: indolepyruvate oxidoreductase subunit beta [Candidatus Pacearchaeota archaeon]|nr:MAG: indolepyruvate oxidoreductase subunit beta [Candidatus Pacearchaeota archaeon]